MNRRNFLRLGTGAVMLGSGVTAIPLPAQAASSYRAVVMVMLYGGNDGMNMLVPLDATRFAQYTSVRGALALKTASESSWTTGPLVPVAGGAWGLHPRLAALQLHFNAGRVGALLNVGPLARPTTRTQFTSWRDSSTPNLLPESLFSHSDQQKLWQNGVALGDTSSVGSTGWGQRAADQLSTRVYSFGGNSRFGTGASSSALILPEPGTDMTNMVASITPSNPWAPAQKLTSASQLMMQSPVSASAQMNALATLRKSALAAIDQLSATIKAVPGGSYSAIDSAFTKAYATTPSSTATAYSQNLGKQLYQVAKMIADNAKLGGTRHLFFVSLGGFDTHGNQLATQAALLSQLGIGVASFLQAMISLGLSDAVTLATMSDFGRTFKPNNSGGTDHAWGNYQLVAGGAVKGGGTWGTAPEYALGGSNDAGVDSWEQQGRWIPTSSVDQYAATLLSWLGLSASQNAALLPNLANFSTANLGFLGA
ncbi:DUF1501 domain-containing protein [Derxia gummosa]|uniref:DUF1501 domain-containing protein n=1 Tax=Derxia gummosa DSM 723 TaxID=1121388 RepID=A0A8B6X390_9BURK|nr:DUF1501 domain-containing protein [Derxia gummosa]